MQQATVPVITGEMELVRELIAPLFSDGVSAERVQESEEMISVSVRRTSGWKLRCVVFSRKALQKLLVDPLRAVKIDYLRRDLLRSVSRREEFRYPRSSARVMVPRALRPVRG